MDIPESPHSRQEEYLAAIAGLSSEIPESPQSRQEAYLDYIIKNTTYVKTMPEPSSENEGRIVQYAGDTTESYINGYFYKSVNDSGEYKWINISVQEPGYVKPESGITESDLSSDVQKKLNKPYLSIVRSDKYLFEVTYDSLVPDNMLEIPVVGACSSYVEDGELFTNLDWNYDECATFHITGPGFDGTAFMSGLTATDLNDELIGQLPYHIRDGANEHGIKVATHVLFNDWEATGAGAIPLTKLPYLVLTNVKSMATLEDDLDGILGNLYIPSAMVAEEYLIQVLVTDGTTTYVLCPSTDGTVMYEAIDATDNPKLTNFLWVADATVDRSDLQTRPTGVERWNMMPAELSELRFTKAYEAPDRLSEFIGINGTDKDSTDEELIAIYNLAHTAYQTRTRDGSLWQTMHSVVYGANGLAHLWIQENWDKDFIATGFRDSSDNIASKYDPTKEYNQGDLTIQDSLLYKAKQDIEIPEKFNPLHWEQTTVDSEFVKNSTIIVTCTTQDGVLVTGQMVYVRKGSYSGELYTELAYNGQPVSVTVPKGFDYYISVSDNLSHHFNPTTVSGVANSSVISVTLTYSDFSSIRTFPDIKAALNSGEDLTDLVEESVTLKRQNTNWEFDVIDYTNDVITLMAHTVTDNKVFEPKQALAWFENGLSAGVYKFKNGSTYYYFTLTSDIPSDGQLYATTSTFSTYSNCASSTVIESGSVSTTEIIDAVDLGTCGQGNLNHMNRVNYGANNIGESGAFAWLNSDAEPNTNILRQNKFSRPYGSGPDGGWLNGIDAKSLAVIDDTVWTQTSNNVYEAPAEMGGITTKNTQYNITGKFCLAAENEISGSSADVFDLYVGATNTDRIKYFGSSARYWWLRTPTSGSAYYERYVVSNGSVSYNYGLNSLGFAPVCKISKSKN